MKIAVDIDEVLAASFAPILDGVKNEIVFPFEFEDLIEHDWWKLPGCPVEKPLLVNTFVKCFEHLSRNNLIAPLPGSKAGIE
ncbi:MAG: hypothetical protein ACOYN2_05530 [Patescibacteria group bacterium]